MLTYSGIHVATSDEDAIVAVLTETLAPGGYRRRQDGDEPPAGPVNVFLISRPFGGWITILASNDLDGREFAWAETISTIGASAIWLYLYESDFVMYRLYKGGQLLDRYNSKSAERLGAGNPRVFRPMLVEGATIEDLDRVLRPSAGEELAVEERYLAIARLLGIQTAELSFEVAATEPLTLFGGPSAWEAVEFFYTGEIGDVQIEPDR